MWNEHEQMHTTNAIANAPNDTGKQRIVCICAIAVAV